MPSLAGKLCKKTPVRNANLGTSTKVPDATPVHDWLNMPVLTGNKWICPMMQMNGRHILMSSICRIQNLEWIYTDFGFVRGSDFWLKTDSSETITRIDGKNSYCLIVECATHYPVTAVCKILDYLVQRMQPMEHSVRIVWEVYIYPMLSMPWLSKLISLLNWQTLTLTCPTRMELLSNHIGTQSSDAMYASFFCSWQCRMVFGTATSSHSKLGTTPFQAFTGNWAHLSRCQVFGSHVYARTTGKKTATWLSHKLRHFHVFLRHWFQSLLHQWYFLIHPY